MLSSGEFGAKARLSLLTCTTAMGLALAATPARAQGAPDPAPAQLPAVSVEGERPPSDPAVDYQTRQVSSPKYTQPLIDTPQTISVVPQAVIEDRAATTLRDVLRNVAGVTLQAGEGGSQGDSFRIRGFNATTDVFVDGMRDLAEQPTRDPFNLEALEVPKGPSSSYAGRGSTGGTINQVSKTPRMEDFIAGGLTLGTDNTVRVTGDVNQIIDAEAGSALRLNMMRHESGVAGRDDNVEAERWGFAPSLALGMNKDTRLTLSYMHQEEDNVPDYGLPFINQRPPPGVDRSNWYGINGFDKEEVTYDMVTAKVEHDVSENTTLRNTLRYSRIDTDRIVTAPRGPNLATDTMTRNGGNVPNRQRENELLIDQMDATFNFDTGGLKHTAVAGVEVSREWLSTLQLTFSGVPGTSLSSPDPDTVYARINSPSFNSKTDVKIDTGAIYAMDTVELGSKWELSGGLRYDYVDADFTSVNNAGVRTDLSRTDGMLSYRAGLVFKPAQNGRIYVAYGTSFNPAAEAQSLSSAANNAANANVDPEKNITYEIGTKWDVFDQRLSLSGALFRIEKTNARTEDPTNPGDVIALEGKQRVDGIELAFAGSITPVWKILGGYTFMQSEVLKSANAAEVGNDVGNTPDHTFSLWSTYTTPWKFEVGYGVQFVSDRKISNTNVQENPGYWLHDAMISYPLTPNVNIQLNVFNIFDTEYFERLHAGGAHGIPGAGRTALLSTNFKF